MGDVLAFIFVLGIGALGLVIAGFLFVKLWKLLHHEQVHSRQTGLFLAISLITPGPGWLAAALVAIFSINPARVEEEISAQVDKMPFDELVKLVDDQVLSDGGQGNEAKWVAEHWLKKTDAEKLAFVQSFWEPVKTAVKKQATITPLLRHVHCDWVKALRTAHYIHTGTME